MFESGFHISITHKLRIAVIIIAMVAILFNTYFDNSFYSTKIELNRIHKANFENEIITDLSTWKYPGKGRYNKFKTNKHHSYLPILLAKESASNYELFTVGTIISKEKNSYEATIVTTEKSTQVKFRSPEDVGNKTTSYIIITIATIFATIIQFFIPDKKSP